MSSLKIGRKRLVVGIFEFIYSNVLLLRGFKSTAQKSTDIFFVGVVWERRTETAFPVRTESPMSRPRRQHAPAPGRFMRRSRAALFDISSPPPSKVATKVVTFLKRKPIPYRRKPAAFSAVGFLRFLLSNQFNCCLRVYGIVQLLLVVQ